MKSVLNPWYARSMTLMGKVVVVNSLVMSLAVHKVLCVGSPESKVINEIRKIIKEFL